MGLSPCLVLAHGCVTEVKRKKKRVMRKATRRLFLAMNQADDGNCCFFGVSVFRLLRWCTLIGPHSLTAHSISKQEGGRNQQCFSKAATEPGSLEGT